MDLADLLAREGYADTDLSRLLAWARARADALLAEADVPAPLRGLMNGDSGHASGDMAPEPASQVTPTAAPESASEEDDIPIDLRRAVTAATAPHPAANVEDDDVESGIGGFARFGMINRFKNRPYPFRQESEPDERPTIASNFALAAEQAAEERDAPAVAKPAAPAAHPPELSGTLPMAALALSAEESGGLVLGIPDDDATDVPVTRARSASTSVGVPRASLLAGAGALVDDDEPADGSPSRFADDDETPPQSPLAVDDDDASLRSPLVVADDDDEAPPRSPLAVADDDDEAPPRNPLAVADDDDALPPPRNPLAVADDDDALPPPRNPLAVADDDDALPPPRNPLAVADDDDALPPPRNPLAVTDDDDLTGDPLGGLIEATESELLAVSDALSEGPGADAPLPPPPAPVHPVISEPSGVDLSRPITARDTNPVLHATRESTGPRDAHESEALDDPHAPVLRRRTPKKKVVELGAPVGRPRGGSGSSVTPKSSPHGPRKSPPPPPPPGRRPTPRHEEIEELSRVEVLDDVPAYLRDDDD